MPFAAIACRASRPCSALYAGIRRRRWRGGSLSTLRRRDDPRTTLRSAAERDRGGGAVPVPNRADMDKKTEDGLTPLALAAQGGHVDVVRFLCEAGADLAALPVTGPSALSWAVNSSCKDLAWEASCPSGVIGRGKRTLGNRKQR